MLKHDIYWFTARCLTVTFLFLLLPVISHSSQLIYTIQTGSYVGENDARNYYDSVVESFMLYGSAHTMTMLLHLHFSMQTHICFPAL
jgi:hypothetical protein